MAWLSAFPTSDEMKRQAEKAFHVQLGMASPLWLAFGAAASAGAAWWWAARLAGATNLEAVLDSRFPLLPGAALLAEALAEADAEAEPVDAMAEEGPDPTAAGEPVAEVAAEPVMSPAPAVEAAPEPVEPVAAMAPDDDLTQLVGVGPKVAKALAERGVTRFAQLAAWTSEDMARFDAELKLLGRGTRDAWIAQAKRLATGN